MDTLIRLLKALHEKTEGIADAVVHWVADVGYTDIVLVIVITGFLIWILS